MAVRHEVRFEICAVMENNKSIVIESVLSDKTAPPKYDEEAVSYEEAERILYELSEEIMNTDKKTYNTHNGAVLVISKILYFKIKEDLNDYLL